MRKELFVCDMCGAKSRMDGSKRHWCKVCPGSAKTELRPVRIKKTVEAH